MSEQQGIDVAWPQGARYNWQQWAGTVSFGMCKATEGTMFTDPDFADNWNAMWDLRPDHRLPRFSYHFFHAAQDPEGQAEHLVATVKAHGLLPGDNFVGDFEETGDGLNDGVAPAAFALRAVRFLRRVNELAPGHRMLVYTNPSFAQAGNCAGMGSWYLWLASYQVPAPVAPLPWNSDSIKFWQYDDAPIDGDRFLGDEAELLAFCRMPKSR